MTLKDIQLTEDGGALYRQLADGINRMVSEGALKPGDRLPPQRDIARQLGINLTTVTRAFATLQQRGLVESRAGRGSLILGPASALEFVSSPADEAGLIDLTVNRPATTGYLEALAQLMARMPRDPRYASLQDFHAPHGAPWAREAVAKWLAPALGGVYKDRVVVTNGAQSGLVAVLGAIVQSGDVILADAVTYQGITNLCRTLDVTLVPVEMDREGMRPNALEAACVQWQPRAVFVVPCLQNPTTATLSAERRAEIADIARRHDCLIVEDDPYRQLLSDAPPSIASLAPDITIYISSFSKTIAPGLRYGAVVAPEALVDDIAAMQRVACWSISPLNSLVGTLLIEEGRFDTIVTQQREELRHRQGIVAQHLSHADVQTHPESPHIWIHLPDPWRSASFVAAAQERGVAVLPGEAFVIGREPAPHAVRVNIGAARSRAVLAKAVQALGELLALPARRVSNPSSAH